MAIREYNDDIARDFAVLGDNVYMDNGQGCGTIWFKTVPECREFYKRIGWRNTFSGRDSGLCNCCRCSKSYGTPEYNKLEDFMCHKWKEDIKAEILNKH